LLSLQKQKSKSITLKKILILAVFLMAVMLLPAKTDAMKLVTSCGTVYEMDFPSDATMHDVFKKLKELDERDCNSKPPQFQKREELASFV